MDIMTVKDLKYLSELKSDFLISIYLPTHRFGRETQQDPIRFKNLINEAESRLLAEGLSKTDINDHLEPARDLLENVDFWEHASDGLALFISRDDIASYRLPISFDELIVISSKYHLKPLLPFFTLDGHFYVLALSQNQIQLFEGTKHSIDEIVLEDTLPNMAEALKYDQFSKEQQFHTGTSATQDGQSAAMFHGHHPKDDEKKRLLQWFQKVDQALTTLLVNEKSPMVLAGVDYLIPIFKEANSYPYVVENGIFGNPEELTPNEIQAKAWPIVAPIFTSEKKVAIDKYHQLKPKQLTAMAIDDILFSSHQGRIETLFVALGKQIWGQYDLQNQKLEVHQEQETGDHDLLNISAIQTILTGGTVFAVELEKVPDGNLAAAIYRY